MALDPSISLGVRPPEAVDFSKFAQLRNLGTQNALMEQQISASQTGQRKTEVEIPGAQAESERLRAVADSAKQDQLANDHLISLAATNKYTTKAADGSNTIDYPRLIGDASTKFPKQALAFGKTLYDTKYQEELARGQAAIASGNESDTAGKLNKFGNDAIQTLANVIDKSNIPDDQKGTAFQEALKRQVLHYPAAFANSPYATVIPGQPASKGPNGEDIPAKPPEVQLKAAVNAGDVKKIAYGSMTPLISAELAISQNKLELEKLQASLGYKVGVANIVPAGDAAALKLKAAEHRADATLIAAGADADVKSIGGGAPGAIAQQTWQAAVAKGGPAFQLQASLDRYNKANNTQYTVWGNGVDAVKDMLRKNAAVKQSLANELDDIGTPKVPGGAPTVPNVKSTPTPAQPVVKSGNAEAPPAGYAEGSIRMRKGTAVRWIDASKIEKARADGFKSLSEK